MTKLGRPSKYDPAFCEKVVEFFKLGMSKCEIGLELGITEDTFYRWIKEYPDFSEAIKTGMFFAQGQWESEGRKSLRDKDFNSTLWYMNMKNRFGWRDRQETDSTIHLHAHEADLEKLK